MSANPNNPPEPRPRDVFMAHSADTNESRMEHPMLLKKHNGMWIPIPHDWWPSRYHHKSQEGYSHHIDYDKSHPMHAIYLDIVQAYPDYPIIVYDTLFRVLRAELSSHKSDKKRANLVLAVIQYAFRKHMGVNRKGGDALPYIIHPLRVALDIRTAMPNVDHHTTMAAILHDTVEDMKATHEVKEQELKNMEMWAGPDIARMVREKTDDKRLSTKEIKQRQLLDAPKKSLGTRIVIVGDKGDNCKTVSDGWSEEKCQEYYNKACHIVEACRLDDEAPEILEHFKSIIAKTGIPYEERLDVDSNKLFGFTE